MRKVVLAMMTTLNGRIDDPDAWVPGVSEELLGDIDEKYATYDTILVGRTTYDEMFAYWPGAETDEGSSDINKSMARKMNSYKKFVFTAGGGKPLEWNNAEQVAVRSDEDVSRFVNDLKAQPGGDIHLAGGARLAQTIVRLGLVDEYRFMVHPVVSAGAAWFDQMEGNATMDLQHATTFQDGVVVLHYRST